MLRNYPLKTTFGFIIWFVAISALSAFINYPVVRIIAYTSLIFYAVIQGWSIHETYKQELDMEEEKRNDSLTVVLSPEKRKRMKIIIYCCISFSLIFGIWSFLLEGISVQLIVSLLFAATAFLCFRMDTLKELQTAREICMSTAVILLFFVLMLPLSFHANIAAAAVVALLIYLSGAGIDRSSKNIVRLTLNDFREMEDMERIFYDDKYITPAEEAYRWYDVYPYTTVASREGNQIAGFINMFPVKPDIVEKIKEGSFNDASLELKDIQSIAVLNPEKRADMFLSCIVVRKEYQNEGTAMSLLLEALIQYEEIHHCIDHIYADAATKDGQDFAEKIGFTALRESDHDSVIYEADFHSFREYVLNHA